MCHLQSSDLDSANGFLSLVHVNTLQVMQGSLELTFHVDEM